MNKALIIGKWYTNKKWSPKSYAKFTGYTTSTGFGCRENIVDGEYHSGNGSSWHSPGDCILASKEDLNKFLPKNHPDLKVKIHEIW